MNEMKRNRVMGSKVNAIGRNNEDHLIAMKNKRSKLLKDAIETLERLKSADRQISIITKGSNIGRQIVTPTKWKRPQEKSQHTITNIKKREESEEVSRKQVA